MRVRLIKRTTVDHFAKEHANGKIHFDSWLLIIKFADWLEPADITNSCKGNLIGGSSNRVVFDLGGNGRNSFRIICEYKFGIKYVHLYVNWIGTHEKYNSLTQEDRKTIDRF